MLMNWKGYPVRKVIARAIFSEIPRITRIRFIIDPSLVGSQAIPSTYFYRLEHLFKLSEFVRGSVPYHRCFKHCSTSLGVLALEFRIFHVEETERFFSFSKCTINIPFQDSKPDVETIPLPRVVRSEAEGKSDAIFFSFR